MFTLYCDFRHRQLMVKSMMNKMLVPMLLPLLLLLDVTVPVSSAEVSVQVISYRTSRKIQNGQVMCALDVANKTMSSSSLQDCSLSCARDATCKSFNIKNSLTCDHVMSPVLASTSRTQTPVICTITNRRSQHLIQRATTTRSLPLTSCVFTFGYARWYLDSQ